MAVIKGLSTYLTSRVIYHYISEKLNISLEKVQSDYTERFTLKFYSSEKEDYLAKLIAQGKQVEDEEMPQFIYSSKTLEWLIDEIAPPTLKEIQDVFNRIQIQSNRLQLENIKKQKRQQAFKVYDNNKYKINFLLLENNQVVKKESGYTADKIVEFLQNFIDTNAFPSLVNTIDGVVTIPSEAVAIIVQNEVKVTMKQAFKSTYYMKNLVPILSAINSATSVTELNQISITKPPAIEIDLSNY